MTSYPLSKRYSAVQVAFFGSLLLSLLALLNNSVINRDGIVYVETARIFLQDGLPATFKSFNWPFLSILMALVSRLTGMGLEQAGHVLNALFMAGTCALIVASAERRMPEAAWAVCLVVLTLPAYNQYRDEILREYGCWFFMTLSFWFALEWAESPRWRNAFAVQLALAAAVLFRPEAIVFFAIFPLWQLFSTAKGEKWRCAFTIGFLPLLGFSVLLVLFFSGKLDSGHRLYGELSRMSLTRFDAKAQALSAALIPYARDQARIVLFLGSIAMTPLKFVRQLGIFIVPLLYLFRFTGFRSALSRMPLFAWAFLAHLIVLSVFVVDMQFLAGRYVAVLSLLATPFIGLGCWQLTQHFPRWKNILLAFCILLMVSNVVSLNPGHNHFRQAGAWLAANTTESSGVYIEGSRTAYYAGWRTGTTVHLPEDRSSLSAGQQKKYDLFVLEVPRRDKGIDAWLASNDLREVVRFRNARNDSVLIAKRNANP